MLRPILMIALVGMLSACISGTPKSETYTDRKGETIRIENDHEICTDSCNGDYDRCMETAPARRDTEGMPSDMGASGDCRSDLQKCLSRCKSL